MTSSLNEFILSQVKQLIFFNSSSLKSEKKTADRFSVVDESVTKSNLLFKTGYLKAEYNKQYPFPSAFPSLLHLPKQSYQKHCLKYQLYPKSYKNMVTFELWKLSLNVLGYLKSSIGKVILSWWKLTYISGNFWSWTLGLFSIRKVRFFTWQSREVLNPHLARNN